MEHSKQRQSPDRDHIDVSNAEELRIWAMSMGVTVMELRHAVETAGTRADKVREYLQHQR